MSEHIPGSIDVYGREFFYVETPDQKGFRQVIDEALTGSPELPLPKDGGIIEEKARIILDSSTSLLGVSYKGDLDGWRAKLQAYCKARHCIWGIATRQRLVLSDGTERPLGECKVVFED